jgi:hypothetical protein
LVFLIPIVSILSSLSLIPAVSKKLKVIPSKYARPSTTSRVVPAISLTIALSSFIKLSFVSLSIMKASFKPVLIPKLIIQK